jgi:hypothetical protein
MMAVWSFTSSAVKDVPHLAIRACRLHIPVGRRLHHDLTRYDRVTVGNERVVLAETHLIYQKPSPAPFHHHNISSSQTDAPEILGKLKKSK